MKVGIIGFSNLRYMPYLNYYTDIFDRNDIEYEIIYWNRRCLNEEWRAKTFAFIEKLDDSAPKAKKILAMISFGIFAKNKIIDRNYDFLVTLTNIPTIMLGNYIKKAYPKRYVTDTRDYTYERFFIYRKILESIFSKAAMRVISSPAFKNFLPANDYIVCHNLSIPKNSDRNIRTKKPRNKRVINISYIGAIAYYAEVIKLLDVIANDSRFVFSFYGSGIDEQALLNFCLSKGINNVYFHGMYQPSEKEAFYGETDVVYNAYGNNSLHVRYLLSNKLYDAAWYRIPILVSPCTAMSEMAGYIGFELDYKKPSIADKIYNWYNDKIDWDKCKMASDALIDRAFEDNRRFEKKLLDILNVKE